MALTKITVGMENGVPAIEQNFEILESAANANAAAVKYIATTLDVAKTSFSDIATLQLQRWGRLVILSGVVDITAAANWKTLIATTAIPNGYKPVQAAQASATWGSTSHNTESAFLYTNTNGVQIICSDGFSSGSIEGALHYFTDDDFPD